MQSRGCKPTPRVADSAEIAVVGDGGIVMLPGTVERFSQRRAAEQDAGDIEGVYEVINHLKVNLRDTDRREDDEIRGVGLRKLLWDADVPANTVEIEVRDGWVTLKDDLSYQFQSDAAFDDVSSLCGVAGVTNEIKVTTP
jgi:osmotically-inducible protein OsmY